MMKLLLALVAVVAVFLLMSSSMFDIKDYEVEGNSYYSDNEILTMGGCKTGENIFWNGGLSDIKKRLSRDAYMESVSVRRALPDTIRIIIKERKQTAAIVYGSEYVVIDGDGIVLRKTTVEPKIPVVRGLTISGMELGQPIDIDQRVQLRQTLQVLESMEKNDMYFKKMQVSEMEMDAYVFDQLICRGTAEHLMESMESGRLQVALQSLFDQDIYRGVLRVSGESFISFSPKLD